MLTHGSSTYIGGADSILENFRPRNVLLNPVRSRSPEYHAVERAVLATLPPQPSPKPGEHFGPWTILHPDSASSARRAEDNALVLLGEIDGVRILLLSQLSHDGQLALLSRTNDLHADILVTALPDPMHITPEPFSNALLEAVHPRVIIVHDTNARHADERLISQLSHLGIPILFTRQTQSITLTTRADGHWQLVPMNGQSYSP